MQLSVTTKVMSYLSPQATAGLVYARLPLETGTAAAQATGQAPKQKRAGF
jgi:hypothetical protein